MHQRALEIEQANKLEEGISEFEDRNLNMTQEDEERTRNSKKKKNERTLQELSDYIKKSNIRIIGIPKGEEREKGIESLPKEITDENSASLWKNWMLK